AEGGEVGGNRRNIRTEKYSRGEMNHRELHGALSFCCRHAESNWLSTDAVCSARASTNQNRAARKITLTITNARNWGASDLTSWLAMLAPAWTNDGRVSPLSAI